MEGTPIVVAPRDRKAGGTWIGASGTGLVAALSNRRGRNSPSARSRGLLVLDSLRQSSVPAADIFLQREVAAHEYNLWNLFVASRREVRFFAYDGQVSMARGHEGLNVLTNEGGNVPSDPKVATVQGLFEHAPHRAIHDAVVALQSALRHHEGAGSVPLCVHGAGGGTVSSTILALSNATPEENVLLYADGSPCSNPYRDYHDAIRGLPSPD